MSPYTLHQYGTGAPLLILHGFTGDGASFIARLPHLSQHVHLIAPDLLGHGLSPSPTDATRYAMPQAVADLARVCDALDIHKCAVLGYSMGGRLALGFAVHHPQRVSALILESASAGLATAHERHARIQSDTALAQRILANGIPAFVDEWERLPLWASQTRLPHTIRQQLRDQRLHNNPQGLAYSLLGMGTGAQPYLGDSLGVLTMPVLLIAGALDTKFTQIATTLAGKIPQARVMIVPDAGHAVHIEAPEAYQTAVANFLRDI